MDQKNFQFSKNSEKIKRLVALSDKKGIKSIKDENKKNQFKNIHFNTENCKNFYKENSLKDFTSNEVSKDI